MPVNSISKISRDDQFSTIKIYSFEDENFQGTFSNGVYGENKVFLNLISLIMMIEDCMNSISFPQPMALYRKMNTASELESRRLSYRDKAEIDIPEAEVQSEWPQDHIVSFRFRVAFRTISGWQGEAECLESGSSIRFRSDLEFIRFMVKEIEKVQNGE